MNFLFFNTSRIVYRVFFSHFSWSNKLKKYVIKKLFDKEIYKQRNMVWCVEKLCSDVAHPKRLKTKMKFLCAKNCLVTGGSRFIANEENASLDIARFSSALQKIYKDFYLQEELKDLVIYNPNLNNQIIHLKLIRPFKKLSGSWFSILHSSTGNWMHFLSECAPRLCTVISNDENKKFGILYDEDIPQTILDMIKILVKDRPMLAVKGGKTLKVSKLLVPIQDSLVCTAFWPRPGCNSSEYYNFDRQALQAVRNLILKHFSVSPSPKNRLYINRESKYRHISNQHELASFLDKKGFKSIFPGSMSLRDQIQEFSAADIVVAQAGAALGNMIFMPRGSTLICLMANNKWAVPRYFQEYGEIFGVNCIFVSGEVNDPEKYSEDSLGSTLHPMNSDFKIALDKVTEVLESI